MASQRRVTALLAVAVAATIATAVPAAAQPGDPTPSLTLPKPQLAGNLVMFGRDVAEGAVPPPQLLLPTLSLGALDTSVLAFPSNDTFGHSWQVLPKDTPSDWEARHNEALRKLRASTATTVAGFTALFTGLAMASVELSTEEKTYCENVHSCFDYNKTNKALAAGGWFTASAGGIILSAGTIQEQSASAELAALEAERLRVQREPVTATGTGLSDADPWKRVSDLQPGQFIRLDVLGDQGRNKSGWFVQADDQKVTLYDGKQVVAVGKDSIRRVRAVPLGRERSWPKSTAIASAGIVGSIGAWVAMTPQGELFGATDIIGDQEITWRETAPLICAMGASTVATLVVRSRGIAKTIYDANARPAARRSTSSAGATTAPNGGKSGARSEKDVAILMLRKGVGVAFVARW